MPLHEHVSSYPHPRPEVFAWHERPGAFVRLTPPGLAVLTQPPTDGVRTGSAVALRMTSPVLAGGASALGLAGAPGVPWTLCHLDYVAGERFADEQRHGPFRRWRHDHLFGDGPDGSTTLTDRVAWELPFPAPAAIADVLLRRFFRFREAQLRDDLALHARLAAPRPLHVVVAGSSGLIGTQLCALLTTGGHRVTRLVRRDPAAPDEVSWDPGATGTGAVAFRPGRLDPGVLADADAVVNLAGRSVGSRFTPRAKQEIHHSRVDATRTLAQALAAQRDGRPRTLLQASGIGFYGARRPGELLTEDSGPGGGFLADVVRHWEAAASPAVAAGVRVAHLRIGIVLSEAGGALLPQVPLFALGLGGPLTRPDAQVSWITLDDAARACVHVLLTPSMRGPYNVVAPEPVSAREFATTLGRSMNRPAAVGMPAFAPRAVLGRGGYDQIVRTDQRVSARALVESGFEYGQPRLDDALRHVLMR